MATDYQFPGVTSLKHSQPPPRAPKYDLLTSNTTLSRYRLFVSLFPPQNVSSRGQTSCPVVQHAAGAREMLAHERRNDDHKESAQSNHKEAACFRKRITEQKRPLDESCRSAGRWLFKKTPTAQ